MACITDFSACVLSVHCWCLKLIEETEALIFLPGPWNCLLGAAGSQPCLMAVLSEVNPGTAEWFFFSPLVLSER